MKIEKLQAVLSSDTRLDKFLSTQFENHSRSFLQQLIKSSKVKVNGTIVTIPKSKISNEDRVKIEFPDTHNYEIPDAENFNFQILFEDNDILIINKPSGIVVHPAAGNWNGTVVNALMGKDPNFADRFTEKDDSNSSTNRPGIVHRLDKDTSGCLIIAKNLETKYQLSKAFAERQVTKTYYALTSGYPRYDKKTIVTTIGRHPVNRKKMSVLERGGKEAITIYNVVQKGLIDSAKVSLIKVNILTGRTHQIRVHLAYLKTPILGDKLYGGTQKLKVCRQMLHAESIKFIHPSTKEKLDISAPYPEDFFQLMNQL